MLIQSAKWVYKDITVEGVSLAGVRTCLTLPQHSLAFDVAQGLPFAVGVHTFLITHGHMDHAAGIPYLISQKAMNAHKAPRFIMPVDLVSPMTEIMNQWSRIEGHRYNFEFIGLRPGEELNLKPHFLIRPFETIHRVPCQGYSVIRKFRKLKKELEGIPAGDISEIHKKGEEVTEERSEIILSFTGDTQIEFLDKSPQVKDSKILVMEATYLDDRKSIESTREWGHIHLDELLPRLSEIKSEKILLIHSSARYSLQEAEIILQKRLPASERERVTLFPGR